MNKMLISFRFLLFAFLCFSIAACGDDTDDTDTDTGTNNCATAADDGLIAKVDGVSWSANIVSANDNPSGTTITIAAVTTTGSQIQLSNISAATGTTSLTGGKASYVKAGTGVSIPSTSGTLTISSYGNGTLSGTFSFTASITNTSTGAVESYAITCGSFSNLTIN